jgi:hypothetical protein
VAALRRRGRAKCKHRNGREGEENEIALHALPPSVCEGRPQNLSAFMSRSDAHTSV